MIPGDGTDIQEALLRKFVQFFVFQIRNEQEKVIY